MTNWLPDISTGDGPLYLRLADRIESDIGDGTLPSGARLPPQRNLAFDIGVTVGTVGRAYALLRERGLVTGEVGRGTYVIDHAETSVPLVHESGDIRPTTGMDGTRFLDPPSGKLRLDNTAAPENGQSGTIGTILAEIVHEHGEEVSAYARRFPDAWFEAGARWLARGKFRPAPEDIVPSLGAHAGIVSIISAMTSPGDTMVFEHVTYSQISRSAGLLGRRTVLARSDEHGLIPEDFEHVCAQRHPKVAFLMP
ncbi:MAG: PLP-dependent aminotransferase family protein, partial [Pseudomonadota bacterium]|nr:PLP-dependent aminotransferase family protein [Pseudomonadota bacterium]